MINALFKNLSFFIGFSRKGTFFVSFFTHRYIINTVCGVSNSGTIFK